MALIDLHNEQPHLRMLQKRLAQEITTMVHGQANFENAEKASTILYSKSFKSDIQTLDEVTFLDIFEGVPTAEVPKNMIDTGLGMIAALSAETKFLGSNAEARRALKENSISVNKEKVGEDYKISKFDLINNSYIIINRGKRSTFIIRVI